MLRALKHFRGRLAAKIAGKPMLPDELSRDMARILRPQAAYRWLLPQLAAITPQYIEMTLRGAMAGSHVQAWELFDLMEDTSPRLAKNLNELKRAVQSLNWKLMPHVEENEAPTPEAMDRQKLVNAALTTMRPNAVADENDLSGTIYDIMDAWAKGQVVTETDWEVRMLAGKQRIAPRATFWVHPTCYAWSMEGILGLRLELTGNQSTPGKSAYRMSPGVWQSTSQQPLPSGVAPFPDHKFLVSICKAKSGTALGGALLRPLAWWWCAANFSADWLLNLAQVFGLPFRWGTYDPNAPQATIDAICSMLENMGSNGWAAFPAGTTLELKEPAKAGGSLPQDDMLDRAEKQMDLLILGQTLTTDVSAAGGSRALGDVHAGVKAEIVQAAGNWAARVLNTQLIPSILTLNYGDTEEAPHYEPQPDEAEDALANAQRDEVLLQAGVKMPRAWFYKRHDIPEPQPGEETIGGDPAPEAAPGAQPGKPGEETPPGKDGDDEPNDKLAAKDATQAQTDLEDEGVASYASAVASDLEHVRILVSGLQEITDDRVLAQRALEVGDEIERLKADLLKLPKAARALAQVQIAAFFNGLAEAKNNHKS